MQQKCRLPHDHFPYSGTELINDTRLPCAGAEIEEHVHFQQFLRVGVGNPLQEIFLPGFQRDAPFYRHGHDAAVAERDTHFLKVPAYIITQHQKVCVLRLSVARKRLVGQRVILIRKGQLFTPSQTARGHEGERAGSRPQFLRGKFEQFLY